MAPSALSFSPAGDVIERMLVDHWVTWLPYAVAAVALIGLAGAALLSHGGARNVAASRDFLLPGLALAVLGTIAALLTDAVLDGDGLTTFDRPIWQWMVDHRTGALTVAAKVLTQIGSTLVAGLVAVAAAVWLWMRHRRGDAVLVAVVAAGSAVIIWLTKNVVGRQRPPQEYRLVVETNESFPSGHALGAAAIYGVIAVLIVASERSVRTKVLTAVAALTFIVLVGLTRLYLGVHWATDVLAGWISGAAWLLLCLTVRWLWRSWQDNRAAGGPTGADPGLTDQDAPAS